MKTALAWWLPITGSALLLRMGARREITTLVLESLVYLALLVVLARQATLRTLLADLPRSRRWLLAGLVGVLLATQLAGRSQLTYPFVQWSMYTTSFAGTRYLDYTAVRADGVEIPFPITDVYPTVGRNVVWKVTELMRVGMGAAPGPQRVAALAELDAILRAYGRRYNQGRATAPVKAIRVWECDIPMDDYRGRASIGRRHVRSVEIPTERATHAS